MNLRNFLKPFTSLKKVIIVLENRPCRIVYYHVIWSTKFSPHYQCIIKAIGIFTRKLYEYRTNINKMAEFPLIKNNIYTIIDIDIANFENLTLNG